MYEIEYTDQALEDIRWFRKHERNIIVEGRPMITWDYRVFREDDGDYIIREVFYAPDGTILGCTANAVEPIGHTLEELAQSIDEFKAALALPVLTLNDMPTPMSTPEQRLAERHVSSAEARALLGLGESAESSDTMRAPRTRKAS